MTREHGPLPRLLAPASWLAARCYGLGVRLRNQGFDSAEGIEILEVHGCRVPVVSVGNVTAGGTGKSPFVAWICNELTRMGKRPVIAMRGYRSQANAQGARVSDEAQEYALSAPSALVVVGARRLARLREVLSCPTVAQWIHDAVVVLDDGFQHRQLARTMDIVLVDATRHALDGDLLPHGWLREPAGALRRAAVVIVTKANDDAQREQACAAVARVRGCAPDATCRSTWSALSVYEDGVERIERVDWLTRRRVIVASAIGNPAQFRVAVELAGAEILAEFRQGDHRRFALHQIETALRENASAQGCVLTRKDFVKLQGVVRGTLIVPKLSLQFSASDEQGLLAAIRASVPLQ